ncbi:putative pumilio homolog 8, chloroplastic [Nymphaea colorata]|nr:putative pumilio homolog 8, chloroplastic [Nymphaea colorata]
MADDASFLDDLFLYGEGTPKPDLTDWTFLPPYPSAGCLPLGASSVYDTQIKDPSRQVAGVRASGDRKPLYNNNDAGSFYNLAGLPPPCCASGNRSANCGTGFNLPGSAVHANLVAEPALSLRQQMVLELVRQHVLLRMMNRGEPFNANMYCGGPVPSFPSCSCSLCDLNLEKLSISDPVSETLGLRRGANRERASRARGKQKSPVHYGLDVLPNWSRVKDERGEQAGKELSTFIQEQQDCKYTSLEEVKGKMVVLAKEQRGGRFLQSKCKYGSPEELQMIFMEIKDHVFELMCDGYGNYLVQALLEACDGRQRIEIIFTVTRTNHLFIEMSIHINGTRVVQKLLETIKSKEEKSLIRSALQPGLVKLMTDSNGNHVLNLWLTLFSDGEETGDIEFIINAAARHCVQIATHPSGCIMMQKCLQHSKGRLKRLLINEIIENSLHLSQDPFGNYIVQHIFGLGIPWIRPKVLDKLKGHFLSLSLQKYSSNVVEECLRVSAEKELTQIIRELLDSPDFVMLLKGEYGNYVAQSALSVSEGYAIQSDLVKSVQANASFLRCPYGKKVLSRANSMALHDTVVPRSDSNRWR